MKSIFSFNPTQKTITKLALFCCCLSLIALTSCASGATTSIGGGAGSRGAGGGIGISFPVGGSSNSSGRGAPQATLSEQREPLAQGESAYIGSNLYSPYPKPNCYEPMKPDRDDSAGAYMLYKQQLDKYRLCVDTYVKNAKNDMQDIEAKANSALREYRLFVTRP